MASPKQPLSFNGSITVKEAYHVTGAVWRGFCVYLNHTCIIVNILF